MIEAILATTGTRRRLIQVRMGLMHGISDVLGNILPMNPVPLWLLNLLDAGLATELMTIPIVFGFEPKRFANSIRYLALKRHWSRDLFRYISGDQQLR
jgi:hypothetical protein